MAMDGIKEGKLLYHLTRLENLDSIIDKGLVSRKIVKNNSVKFTDIANQEIISKREALGLDEYIPFHFHPYSAFDKAVKSTYSQDEFIYIVVRRNLAKSKDFKILPKHPLSGESVTILDYEEGLEAIDWEAMHTKGNENEYIKNVKMAECLTDEAIPVKSFHAIYVKDEETKQIVLKKLEEKGIKVPPPFIEVQRWFD